MAKANQEPRIAGFVCNWGAYSGVEMAGINHRQYPASVKLVKVMCLGRLHLGLLLKAFELGADGVILLGCPPADCHYESGKDISELYSQAQKTLHLLGIEEKRLALIEVPVGRDDILVKQVSNFVKRISRAGSSPLKMYG
ncbi:MAG: hydrogenase iron-sulfur subunit [Dehalococcoidales bacterium]|nr:hydrogenase iron-sulfur subunit [Dehalococcoidales bacterium]